MKNEERERERERVGVKEIEYNKADCQRCDAATTAFCCYLGYNLLKETGLQTNQPTL